MQELAAHIAAHLGRDWRAVEQEKDISWCAHLAGPHGWGLHLRIEKGLQSDKDRIEISGTCGHSSCESMKIGVSANRQPRSIAMDIKRRLLNKGYSQWFEKTQKGQMEWAKDDTRDRAISARLMSIDPQARTDYHDFHWLHVCGELVNI
jgi:hypothetical protein